MRIAIIAGIISMIVAAEQAIATERSAGLTLEKIYPDGVREIRFFPNLQQNERSSNDTKNKNRNEDLEPQLASLVTLNDMLHRADEIAGSKDQLLTEFINTFSDLPKEQFPCIEKGILNGLMRSEDEKQIRIWKLIEDAYVEIARQQL